MDDQLQRPTYSAKSVLLLTGLVAAGFAGNFFALRLFTGFNYLFGSIFALLAMRLFGLRWGLAAGAAAASRTIYLFGHPYAMVWLCCEPIFVGWLLKRGRTRNIILCDAIYWLFVGAPLVWFFFQYVMKVSLQGTVAAMLMYSVIGIANSLLASILLTTLPRLTGFGESGAPRAIPLQQLIFNVMMAIVVIPAVVNMVMYGRETESAALRGLYDSIAQSGRAAAFETRISLQQLASRPVGTSGQAAGIDSELFRRLLVDSRFSPFHQITLLDNSGRVIASTDGALKPMDRYDPAGNGIVSAAEKAGVFRRLPASVAAMPLWQRMQKSFYFQKFPLGSDTGWSIVAEAPFAPYQQAVLRGHISSLLLLLALTLFALLISIYASRRLVAPLRLLSKVTTDLPDRLLREKIDLWPESGVAEIDQLIDNFRAMSSALTQKFQEITHANETLELRVNERTQDITRANEELRREVAERIHAEVERNQLMLELQQKNKELEGIVYVASHDLRSPLVNVQGFSRKLAGCCEELDGILSGSVMAGNGMESVRPILRERIPKSLGFITSSIEKMDGLLSGLLRLSRLGRAAFCFDTLDMHAILRQIVCSMTFQIESGASRVELGDLAPCLGDHIQVNQVFSNLLDNAVKYRSPDRPLLVRVFSEDVPDGVRYCVEDNGMGIPREQQEHIWEIFHRLNPADSEGEGLGLTLSRRIVDRLGGSIRVESDPGIGSRFYVTLPKPPPAE